MGHRLGLGLGLGLDDAKTLEVSQQLLGRQFPSCFAM